MEILFEETLGEKLTSFYDLATSEESEYAREKFLILIPRQYKLRHTYLTFSPEFCPLEATKQVICALQLRARSVEIFRFRLTSYVKKMKTLVRWARKWLQQRNQNIRKIWEAWMEDEANKRELLHRKLYKDARAKRSTQVRRTLKNYIELHTSDIQKFNTVVELYWKKRQQFRKEFHQWYLQMIMAKVDLAALHRETQSAATVKLETHNRLHDTKQTCVHLFTIMPKFIFTVDTVPISELHDFLSCTEVDVGFEFPTTISRQKQFQANLAPVYVSQEVERRGTPYSRHYECPVTHDEVFSSRSSRRPANATITATDDKGVTFGEWIKHYGNQHHIGTGEDGILNPSSLRLSKQEEMLSREAANGSPRESLCMRSLPAILPRITSDRATFSPKPCISGLSGSHVRDWHYTCVELCAGKQSQQQTSHHCSKGSRGVSRDSSPSSAQLANILVVPAYGSPRESLCMRSLPAILPRTTSHGATFSPKSGISGLRGTTQAESSKMPQLRTFPSPPITPSHRLMSSEQAIFPTHASPSSRKIMSNASSATEGSYSPSSLVPSHENWDTVNFSLKAASSPSSKVIRRRPPLVGSAANHRLVDVSCMDK